MSEKALVVDDSRAVRMILARTLREVGYEVSDAGNGVEARTILDREGAAISLALVDWNMPEMNGLDLLRWIRSDSRFTQTRVVMVTTETEMEQVAIAIEAGASEYVMKPFTKEILIDKLQIAGARV